jgi:hypothetical protein
MSDSITRAELRQKLQGWIPAALDADEVVNAVALALHEQPRPVELDLLDPNTLFAWRSEDVPVIEPALRVLGELVAAGFAPSMLGVTLVELVGFLIRLRRNRAKLQDPGQIAVLLALRDGPPGGLSATSIAEQLARSANPPLAGRNQVETVLDLLATPAKPERPHPLVAREGNLWKTLV